MSVTCLSYRLLPFFYFYFLYFVFICFYQMFSCIYMPIQSFNGRFYLFAVLLFYRFRIAVLPSLSSVSCLQ